MSAVLSWLLFLFPVLTHPLQPAANKNPGSLKDIRHRDAFISKEMRAGKSVITTCSYHKSVVYYSRIMAYFCRNGILSSSGDSPLTFIDSFGGGIR
jgi:hypothetical protein